MVRAAGRPSGPDAAAALEELCRIYWYPLYAYARRRGASHADAEDRVQGFFARLLAGDDLGRVDASRGRFRSYLLGAFDHFLANDLDRSRRQKRGGGAVHLSLDWEAGEVRYRLDAREDLAPDRVFDREWALTLLDQAVARLRQECVREGRETLFEEARAFLALDAERPPYAEAGARLGLEPGAMRVAVHRLRRRFRALLREEVARTLADPARVDPEMESLMAALSDAA